MLMYLMRCKAEAAGSIHKHSKVIPQGPAWATAASGHSLCLRPHVLLAHVLELSLGADLKQTKYWIKVWEKLY